MSKNTLKEIKEWVVSILIAALIAFLIKGYLIDVIEVSGLSMFPYLNDNDRLVIEKVILYTDNYKRGEIVIFKPSQTSTDIYIKRVIGLPKDKIELKNGEVYVNNEKINEDYLEPGTLTDPRVPEYSSLIVPDDCIYVLGDNRPVSEDSRSIGLVPISNIKGHAIFRVYPFNHIKVIK